MASNISDDARRAEILRRALLGLDEDIDDLRNELLDALPDYEQRLRQHTGALPEWLKLSPVRVRELFRFSDDSVDNQGILGPRTVALGAGRVEEFVERWFDEQADQALDDSAEASHDELVDDYDAVRAYLDALRDEAERVAGEARKTLERWLDGVLTELDAQRESDIDAIEALVREGEIGRGRTARQEIADLWEEQRHQAAEIQDRWAPITALVDEGLEMTRAGLDELESMLERARQGLVGANPALEERLEAVGPEPATPEEPPAPEDPVAEQVTEQVTEQASEPSRDEADELEDEIDDVGQPTVPDTTRQTDLAVDEPSDTIPDEGFVHGIVPLEEPTSEPEMSTLESSSVSDYSEPELAETSSTPTADISSQRLYTRGGDSTAWEETDTARKTEEIDEPAESDGPAAEEAAEPTAEALHSSCFRIRAGYAPAGLAEIVAVLAPPIVFMLGVAALSVAHLLGDPGSTNPVTHYSWMPAALAVAAAWLFLVPFALGWRTRWSGWRLEILRSADVRQEEELVIAADSLTIGPVRWRYDELEATRLRRWESDADEIHGWVLMFHPPDHPKAYLVAPEPSRRRWQNSPHELVDVPYEAWQLDADDFEELRTKLIG
ncbi:hypothetical protein FIV42_21185 [Persicimonas caeni]|uniref:Uncharacterized protein n=1 Tax=Persicimonas caeni TaxID=2292766 RepID=A0A4Y6PZI8_PERCE|nr:hypothetical protein [Persicimonas caeni]QDG53165.1 hypothetical protein FIV42_21185 [Persicimonas caeni]QED34387.1 hypothetical protein FRD00_21180 [Persicimonas caeni]